MITVSDDLMNVLRYGSFKLHARCWTSYAGKVTATNIPIVAGGETFDDSLNVPERVEIDVPRVVDGVNLAPGDPKAALAAYGQRLHVQLGVDVGTFGIEWFDRGEFLIIESESDGDVVHVTAVGLLALVEEADFVSPYQPSSTMKTIVRNLVEPAIPVVFSADLTDRSGPPGSAGVNYDEQRLVCLIECLNTWPADMLMKPEGYLYLTPDPGTAAPPQDWNLFRYNRTDSPFDRATVIRTQESSSRDGVTNCVVARGTDANGGQVYAAAYDTSTGATRYKGPFNPFPVPYVLQSPFLTTRPQCQAAANKLLAQRSRTTYRRFDAEIVPLPILCGRDGVYVYDGNPDLSQAATGTWVETLDLPYVADGGSMRLTLRTAGTVLS